MSDGSDSPRLVSVDVDEPEPPGPCLGESTPRSQPSHGRGSAESTPQGAMADESRGHESSPAPESTGHESPGPNSARMDFLVRSYLLFYDKNRACRLISSIGTFASLTLALALFVAWPYILLPFSNPDLGFLENWVYNFVAHPAANYIIARCILSWFTRWHQSDSHRRSNLGIFGRKHPNKRMARILTWAPLVEPVTCLAVHVGFAVGGHFPPPMATITACSPGIVMSALVGYIFVPSELLDAAYRAYLRFACWMTLMFVIIFWFCVAFSLLFPHLSPTLQVVGLMVYHAIALAFKEGIGFMGRTKGIPEQLLVEFQIMPSFLSLLFASSLLGYSKSLAGTMLMMGMETVKEAGLLASCILLTDVHVRASQQAGRRDSPSPEITGGFESLLRQRPQEWLALIKSSLATCRRLRLLVAELKEGVVEADDLSHEQVVLLKAVSLRLRHLALVNLDEILVPAIYILISMALYSDTMGYNRPYLFGFADKSYEEMAQGMLLNAYNLILQLLIFAATTCQVQALLGMNFLHFAAITISADSLYWVTYLGAMYMAWLTVLVHHAGHQPLFGTGLFLNSS